MVNNKLDFLKNFKSEVMGKVQTVKETSFYYPGTLKIEVLGEDYIATRNINLLNKVERDILPNKTLPLHFFFNSDKSVLPKIQIALRALLRDVEPKFSPEFYEDAEKSALVGEEFIVHIPNLEKRMWAIENPDYFAGNSFSNIIMYINFLSNEGAMVTKYMREFQKNLEPDYIEKMEPLALRSMLDTDSSPSTRTLSLVPLIDYELKLERSIL